jgi:hypothetical protein
MSNDRLDAAVEQLFTNRRLLRRFQRDPERALRRFALSRQELAALKRGDTDELLALGLSPAIVWPQPVSTLGLHAWLMRHGKRLAPAAFLAAATMAWPAASQAAIPSRVPGLGRASRVLGRNRRAPARVRALIRGREENIRPGPGDIEQ